MKVYHVVMLLEQLKNKYYVILKNLNEKEMLNKARATIYL